MHRSRNGWASVRAGGVPKPACRAAAEQKEFKMQLSSIRNLVPPLSEIVYGHIRKGIFDGTFPVGQPLRQVDIAKQLEISRVPVREALKRLESEGLIVLRPRRGFAVVALDAADVTDLLDVCRLLEGQAGYEAALKRTPEEVDALERVLERMNEEAAKVKTGCARSDLNDWATCHREFHDRLFAASRRKGLCRIINGARDQVDWYIRYMVAITGYLSDAGSEHEALLAAFRAGDAPELSRLCSMHIAKTCDQLLTLIKNGSLEKR